MCHFARDGSVVVDDLVLVRVLSGQHGGTAGRTQRRRHESVSHVGSVASEGIQMRRLQKALPFHESERVVPVIVCEDEDDVARPRPRDPAKRLRTFVALGGSGCRT
jgi:hypothetical protein